MTASTLLPAIATFLAIATGAAEIDSDRKAGLTSEEQGPEGSEASDESKRALGDALVADTNGSCLNLRPAPETVVQALMCIPEGTRLTIIESAPGWRKALLGDGRQGWVAAEYLRWLPGGGAEPNPQAALAERSRTSESTGVKESAVNPPAVRFSESRIEDLSAGNSDVGNSWIVLESAEPCLNFRSDPSSAGKIFECLEPGTVLEPIGSLNGWRYVELDDHRAGWVSGQHVGPINAGGGDGALF